MNLYFTRARGYHTSKRGNLLVYAKYSLYTDTRVLIDFEVPKLIIAIINQFAKKK